MAGVTTPAAAAASTIFAEAISTPSNSCSGRCDDPWNDAHACFCNEGCLHFADCCSDYAAVCAATLPGSATQTPPLPTTEVNPPHCIHERAVLFLFESPANVLLAPPRYRAPPLPLFSDPFTVRSTRVEGSASALLRAHGQQLVFACARPCAVSIVHNPAGAPPLPTGCPVGPVPYPSTLHTRTHARADPHNSQRQQGVRLMFHGGGSCL